MLAALPDPARDYRPDAKARATAFLGLANHHGIHHRGQLASYLRAMGSKVPAICGISARSARTGRLLGYDLPARASRGGPMITLRINGTERTYDGDPAIPLLWYLRDELGLTGTKYGCGMALCGACTVHLDGEAVRACVTTVKDAAGKAVVTIEGLAAGGDHPLQRAWVEHQVAQCGYCQGGQIMQAAALLRSTPAPTDEQIDAAMDGNLCRCGTYGRIREAIKTAARRT
ncbi:MAG: (2Fe-2S)-binding protein [Acidobacteria bacterium]|nr:(2Fe-2S)-binding protein [Acidobacteriota bacterium]